MSQPQAEEEQDTQAVGNTEKRELDYGSVLDSGCQRWKGVEAELKEGPAPLASPQMLLPEPLESDYIASVALAAFLALVFALVSLFLLCHDKGHMPLHDCLALTSHKAPPHHSSLEFLCLLFPSQPESTRQILQRDVCVQQEGSHPERARILAAVGLGNARGTLLCLAKAALSLPTGECTVRVQFPEHRNIWSPWMDFLENGTCRTSTTSIFVGQSLMPYGMMVSLQSSLVGKQSATKINLAVLSNGTEQAREQFLLHAVVSSILSAVRFADGMPDQLMITDGSLPVVLVKSKQYMEDRFAC